MMQRIFFFFMGLIIGLILGQSESEPPAPLPAPPTAPPVQKKPASAPPVTADTLTAIKGIGPSFAQALNAAGIMTFAQLAQLTPDQIASKVPRATVERIEREDWVGQAQRALTQANRKD